MSKDHTDHTNHRTDHTAPIAPSTAPTTAPTTAPDGRDLALSKKTVFFNHYKIVFLQSLFLSFALFL
jgi:hypothetical protein